MAGTRIESRMVKLVLEDVADAEAITAAIDGQPLNDREWFTTDVLTGRCEINLRLPGEIAPGAHQIELHLGSRRFPPVAIEVA